MTEQRVNFKIETHAKYLSFQSRKEFNEKSPRARALGRSIASSEFILASASSITHMCELWRRSRSRRTEFSGTLNSFASLSLDQPRSRIVSYTASLAVTSDGR